MSWCKKIGPLTDPDSQAWKWPDPGAQEPRTDSQQTVPSMVRVLSSCSSFLFQGGPGAASYLSLVRGPWGSGPVPSDRQQWARTESSKGKRGAIRKMVHRIWGPGNPGGAHLEIYSRIPILCPENFMCCPLATPKTFPCSSCQSSHAHFCLFLFGNSLASLPPPPNAWGLRRHTQNLIQLLGPTKCILPVTC